jgi:AAA domain/AAA domain, putative AbiEii toxin, Type IV TA system
MAGSEFVRADLHVHLIPDSAPLQPGDPEAFVHSAIERGIRILGVTDHNTTEMVDAMLAAGSGRDVLVLPGIEITTHQGHLLALFDPADRDELGYLGGETLQMQRDVRDGSLRSGRNMQSIAEEIARRGGIAIAAHVDADDGIATAMSVAELTNLLASEALGGLEFTTRDALEHWFTDGDHDETPSGENRRHGWKARQSNPELRERGLARLMSSDAHSSDLVGKDGQERKLTRLRLDELNFEAVRNAIVNNPEGRCRTEEGLPAGYPRVISAEFHGGFLDGTRMEFSRNLTCLIGGRGSGKSTALLAIRAALGGTLSPRDKPDDAGRMPERTIVAFRDRLGNIREAVRELGGEPMDRAGQPIHLPLADVGQDTSGEVVRQYDDDPGELLRFLDTFCDLTAERRRDRELIALLRDNDAELVRTEYGPEVANALDRQRRELMAMSDAARTSQLDEVVAQATVMANQAGVIGHLRQELASIRAPSMAPKLTPLGRLAAELEVDLSQPPLKEHLEPIESAIQLANEAMGAAKTTYASAVRSAGRALDEALEAWHLDEKALQARLVERRKELEEKGLAVEAGEAQRIGEQLAEVARELTGLRQKQREHRQAREQREGLLDELASVRDAITDRRTAIISGIAAKASASAIGMVISVKFEHSGQRGEWANWLGSTFSFRSPRVQRLAAQLEPRTMARCIRGTETAEVLSAIIDEQSGESFFPANLLDRVPVDPDEASGLEIMLLEDRPRIWVNVQGEIEPREFDRLSTGQQRSVLLSLLLCADRSDPLIVDQPEDHLDATYIASAVVRHLQGAKERRQVIIATHSANLTVLGDAELVIPMYAVDGKGEQRDVGAVDRVQTREHVCSLLEGGRSAYRRRGQRYGFRFVETR